VAALEAWLREERSRLSRAASVAQPIDYMLKRRDAFARFLQDGRICLTNNAAERALRGFALGRKSWLFAGSERGADRAAVMATLIMTAKLNDIDPQAWLADVLARINDHAIHRLGQLLPWNWAAAMERRWWEWSIPTAVSWHQGARGAGLYGSARASALATIDRRYNSDALIVADLSNDPIYAEVLLETFGPRVVGLHISRSGDGMNFERRPVNRARCWSTPLAAPIWSSCCIASCKPTRSALLTDRRANGPMRNWRDWRPRCARPGSSTVARPGSMTTSAYPAPCWPGRRGIRT
jgi:hypothetical protein